MHHKSCFTYEKMMRWSMSFSFDRLHCQIDVIWLSEQKPTNEKFTERLREGRSICSFHAEEINGLTFDIKKN